MATVLVKVAAALALLGVMWFLPMWAALLLALVGLPFIGRLNVAQGRLAIGGGFGHVHTFQHVEGMSVPQCSKCGAWDE